MSLLGEEELRGGDCSRNAAFPIREARCEIAIHGGRDEWTKKAFDRE
jgi:hypothetical protein